MEINSYQAYSMISSATKMNCNTLKEVLSKIEKIDNLLNASEAKQFVHENMGIAGSIKNYNISKDCILNITDNSKVYKVNFIYQNENISFSFRKAAANV